MINILERKSGPDGVSMSLNGEPLSDEEYDALARQFHAESAG
jgi:hypothetical protein